MNITRRHLAALAAGALGATALSACTVTSSGGITSGTLNVAQVQKYFTAGIDAANLMLAIPGISVALGVAGVAAVGVAETAITEAMNAFTAAAGNSVTVSFNAGSVRSAIDSGLAAMQMLLSQFKTVLTKLAGTSVYSQVNITVSALASVVSIFEALLPTVGAKYAAAPEMSEAQALSVLGVR